MTYQNSTFGIMNQSPSNWTKVNNPCIFSHLSALISFSVIYKCIKFVYYIYNIANKSLDKRNRDLLDSFREDKTKTDFVDIESKVTVLGSPANILVLD